MIRLFVDGERLRSVVSWTAAIDVLEAAFASPIRSDSPLRTVLERGSGQLLLMPAWGEDAAGVKLVTVHKDNPGRGRPLINGVYVLFSGDTLEPVCYFDAAPLTALRTAAVSAVATRHLALPEARRLVVFGAGVQAEAHVHAMASVRPVSDVTIVSRTPASGRELLARLAGAGIEAKVGTPVDVGEADLVCTCTTSSEPLFDGTLLRPGAHVNAVGAHTPQTREVDTATVQRSLVVVETRSAAAAEAGDLLIPLGQGEVDPGRVPAAELAEVLGGRGSIPKQGDVTLFKSVGVAFEDLALARFAFERILTPQPQNE